MPRGKARIAVVAATHDRPRRLVQLLDALRAQTIGTDAFEVVIVDDASQPETVEVLRAQLAIGDLALTVIRRDVSGGPGAARNEGWRAASAPLVAFTDDDCAPTPVWLEEALAVFAANDGGDVFIQGPTLPNPDEEASYNAFSHSVWVTQLGPSFETCNIVYPRALLERFGGFDHEAYTMPGGEDTDLAQRMLLAGVRAIWAPDMLVHHAVEQIGPKGKLRLAWRWHETMKVFKVYPHMRRDLPLGIFWRRNHLLLARFLLALALPRRAWPLQWWLAAPYVAFMTDRRSGPLLAPWFVLHDLVEVAACVRGSVRYRTFVL